MVHRVLLCVCEYCKYDAIPYAPGATPPDPEVSAYGIVGVNANQQAGVVLHDPGVVAHVPNYHPGG